MKKLALVFAVGAAALFGGSAANAADNTVKAKAAADVTQPSSTDISSQRRYRHYGHRHYGYRHYGYRHYRPYYGNSYGYAPRPYYGGYNRGYGYGGPGITFGFGGRGW
jgi:hypothetical protein